MHCMSAEDARSKMLNHNSREEVEKIKERIRVRGVKGTDKEEKKGGRGKYKELLKLA